MENTARPEEERIPMELINGKIVMMSPCPRVDHTRVSGAIYRIFSNALQGKRCEAFPDGVDVYLDEKNRFVPDAMIVCDPSKIKPTHIEGAPTLIVEVLSPSTQIYDRGAKMQAYAAAGVQEYWIVDPLGKSVEIYRPQDGRFEIQRVYTYYSPEDIAENATEPERFRLTDEEKEQDIYVDLCGGFHVLLVVREAEDGKFLRLALGDELRDDIVHRVSSCVLFWICQMRRTYRISGLAGI